jgi:hypothetical protein
MRGSIFMQRFTTLAATVPWLLVDSMVVKQVCVCTALWVQHPQGSIGRACPQRLNGGKGKHMPSSIGWSHTVNAWRQTGIDRSIRGAPRLVHWTRHIDCTTGTDLGIQTAPS